MMHSALAALAHGVVGAGSLIAAETAGNMVAEKVPVGRHGVPLALLGVGSALAYFGRGNSWLRTAGIAVITGGVLHEAGNFLSGRDLDFGS